MQFLPAHHALLEEALHDANDVMYEDTPIRVLRAEHLVKLQEMAAPILRARGKMVEPCVWIDKHAYQ